MAERFYTSPFDDNPIVSGGAKRRAAADADFYAADDVQQIDPYKGNWGAEATRSIVANTANDFSSGLEYLGRGLIGDTEGRQRAANDYLRKQEEARAMGPRIQSFEDAEAAGGGVGDYAASLGYQAAGMVPDMVAAVTGFGLGGSIARRGARKAITRSIAEGIEGSAESLAAREVAVKAATRRAALDAPDGAMGVSNAVRVARAQVDDVARRAAMQEAAQIAGRTPRLVAQIERAGAAGRTAGATAASIPGLNGSMNAEKAADGSTSTGDMWALAAGTTAAALTQSVPLERLRAQFGEAALKSITAQGRRFLPRVAAEFGKQGLAEGTQEVAQQALQLASHAYVEKNWGTLTGTNGDGAFDGGDIDGIMSTYLPSFVGGFVLGGAMGGGVEVGRSAGPGLKKAAQGIQKGYASAKDMIKDGLTQWGARVEGARKVKAGEPMDAEGTGVGDLKSWFDKTVEVVGGGLDAVGKTAATARDKFRDITSSHMRAQQDEADADEITAEMGETIAIPGQLRQSSENAFKYGNALESYSMSFVDESKFEGNEAAAQRAAKALGALWQNKPISEDDIRVQDIMVERGLISKPAMQAMRAMGSIASGRAAAQGGGVSSKVDMGTSVDTRAFSDETTEEGGATSLDVTVDEDGSEIDSTNWDQGVGERDALPKSSLAERVANTAPDAPEYGEAVAALQRDLYGEITPKTRLGANIKYQPRPDGDPRNASFLESLKDVGRVEVAPMNMGTHKEILTRAALSVDSLVSRYIAALGKDFPTDDKGQQDLRRAAVMQVFADLKLAGIKVKPNSIKPGTMRTKDGELIATITPTMAKKIRGVFDKFEKGGPNFEPARTTAQLERVPKDKDYQAALDNELAQREVFQGEDQFAGDEGKLLPRVAPEGSTLRPKDAKRDMVSTEEQITNVTIASPYEKDINKVRRVREKGATPSEVREAIHAAGVEIGLAELDRQKADDKINDTRYEREVDELLDYTSGASRRYFKKAADGGFDSAGFTERRAPRDDVDRDAAKEERDIARENKDVEMEEPPLPGVPVSTGTGRYDTTDANAPGPAMKGKKPERLGADITKSKVETNDDWQPGDDWRPEDDGDLEDNGRAQEEAHHKETLAAYRGASHDIAKFMGLKLTDTMKAFWKVTTDPAAKEKLITAIGKTRSGNSLLRIMAYTKRVAPDVFEAAVLRHLELRRFEHNGASADNPTWIRETQAQADDSWSLSGLLSVRKPKTVAEAAAVALTIPGGTDVQRKLLAAMAKSEVLKGVKFVFSVGAHGRSGVHDYVDNQVTVFDTAQQGFIARPDQFSLHDVMVHEFAHALTSRAELHDKAIARDLDLLLEHVRKHMSEAGHPIDRIYGTTTTQEFLAEAFGNPEMQRILAGIPALNTKTFQSAWDEFKSLVGKILSTITGMKLAPTALDEIITIGFAAGKKAKALKLNEIGGNDLSTANAKHAITASAMAAAGPAQAERYTPNDIGSLISFVKYTLPKEERQILDRVFNRGVATTTLREHFKAIPQAVAMLDDAKEGMEARIALGYLAWRAGAFKTGPKGQSSLTQVHDSLMRIFGVAGETDMAQRVLNDIASGRIEKLRRKSIKYSVRDLEARGRGTRQRALNWLTKEGPVSDAAAKFWTSTYARMRDSGVPAMRQLAATLQRPQGATGDEDRGFNPAARLQTMRFHQKYSKIWEGMDETERDHAMMTLQRQAVAGDPAYDKKSPKIRAAVDAMRALYAQAWAYGNDDAIRMWGDPEKKAGPKSRPNYAPVMMDMRDPDAATELGKLYRKRAYREAIFDMFGIPSMERTNEKHTKLVQKLVDAAVGGNVAQVEDGDGLISGTRAQNVRLSQFIYDHGSKEDIHAFAKLQTKNVDEVFARYFSPMAKAGEARRRFGGLEPVIDKKTGKPVIYKGGEKEGETVMKFNPRLKLDAMLEDAKRQGASKDDIALMENAVRAAMGTYGIDGSPTLKAISPALAERFGGTKTKSFVQGVQAYQNLRLLPLSLLSSLVDPMGIAVRTGGGFAETWHGVKQGMKAVTNKKDKAELIALLEDLGASDDFMPALAAHPVFEGQESAVARRINEAVFKWNGMNTWVMSTRIMAMEAGHRFLLKHGAQAAQGDKTSQRYLAELSVEPTDIVTDPNSPNRMALNAKSRAALLQFVDEAILRPNSMQVPLWHRDPYMGLITQYKAFGYAMHDQIVGRIGREFDHGNYRILLAAASYAAVVMMAELLRELIQYGTGGNPNREEWGAPEYAMLTAERSGLLNPKAVVATDVVGDVKRNELPGSSQLGPTGGQVDNTIEGLTGRRALDKEFEAALPASAAWRHWNDDIGAEAAA